MFQVEIKKKVLVKMLIKVPTFWETQKVWKNLPLGFDKSAGLLSKCQNHEADFFKSCVLFKKSELYLACQKNMKTVMWSYLPGKSGFIMQAQKLHSI